MRGRCGEPRTRVEGATVAVTAPRPGLLHHLDPARSHALTAALRTHYTDSVHRIVAALLIPAFLGISSLVARLHTHAYEAHQHPEHQHGLAAHEHLAPPVHRHDSGPIIERCEPRQHAKAFTFIATTPQPIPTVDAALIPAVVTVPTPSVEPALAPADVRVHGPPPRALSSSRAPPSFVLA